MSELITREQAANWLDKEAAIRHSIGIEALRHRLRTIIALHDELDALKAAAREVVDVWEEFDMDEVCREFGEDEWKPRVAIAALKEKLEQRDAAGTIRGDGKGSRE